MKIAVNTRLLLPNSLEGIGRFTWETLKRMCLAHPEHEFHLFFDRAFNEDFICSSNMIPHVLAPQARHPILFRIWFNYSVSSRLDRLKADVFLSPDGYLSLRTNCPQLAVIHDLNFEHRPQDLPKKFLNYYKSFFPKFAKKAARIATVSEYSKKDLVNTYSCEPSKIDVVYNGISDVFKQDSNSQKENYFLYVGSLHPRKNLELLIKAFARLKSKHPDIQLKIVGATMFKEDFLNKDLRNTPGIEFLGRVSDPQLAKLYNQAIALVFPSFFEGFGIPLVEAMACGCPVVSSKATCLPEIAGEAALYFDPLNDGELEHQMELILKDPEIGQNLVQAGLQQKEKYSWDQTAELLWESLMKAAKV